MIGPGSHIGMFVNGNYTKGNLLHIFNFIFANSHQDTIAFEYHVAKGEKPSQLLTDIVQCWEKRLLVKIKLEEDRSSLKVGNTEGKNLHIVYMEPATDFPVEQFCQKS